jgi:stearoyl-CoA desaturase (delta-9 desaturase)
MPSTKTLGHCPPDIRLPYPATALPLRVFWQYAVSVAIVHGLALMAVAPWCFSWSGLIACALGIYIFGTLGINLGYHRLLTHRGLTVPKWLEHGLAILAVCCLQDTPARWAAIHRMHHRRSDRPDDPHSPLVSFFWGHVEWFLVHNRDHDGIVRCERYARDLLHDPLYFWLERKLRWLWLYVAHAALFYLAGLAVGWAATGNLRTGFQFGVSLVVWGVLLRTVVVWHITWSVNSLSHLWGYRAYDTRDQSRNNWLVGVIANGEGWHNNHHWDPRSAAHGHRWWELDVTFLTIRLLERLGLARHVVRPNRPASPTSADGDLAADLHNEASEVLTR